jgi:predicted acetyltransferase
MKETTGERLTLLLEVFSPWDGMSLTYRQFAAELGPPVTEAAVKKWPQRKKFPSDVARLIVARARERGLTGVTLEWLLWGEGAGPQKAPKTIPAGSAGEAKEGLELPTGQEPHGRFAAEIADALEADLSHNEFGQWSSVEVQHTVIWALKDLARRLWVLRFNMGKTFELTDQWAGKIGLPVRPAEPSSEERP